MTANVATIGHNNPPSAQDELKALYADAISEAENWCDGERVQNDGQMRDVDKLIASIKDAERTAKAHKEGEFRPHKDAADAVIAAWKPLLDDLDRIKKSLLSIVGNYKTEKARKVAEEQRRLEAEAEARKREAEAAQRDVDMGDVNQRREADAIAFEAREAERAAQAAKKDKPTGLRTFTVPHIVDRRACINWIAVNDKTALSEFMDDYVKRKTREGVRGIDGVEVRQEQRAV